MPLSDDLRRVYASAPTVEAYILNECLVLSHSAFTDGTYNFVRNRADQILKNFEGVPTYFRPYWFDFKLPTRNTAGAIDMEITFSNVDPTIAEQLELAINAPKEPIVVKFTVYLEGSDDMQIDPPLELTLANVLVNATAVVGTASRADILNRPFPREIFRPDGDNGFPGLNR